jgi:ComF family protein
MRLFDFIHSLIDGVSLLLYSERSTEKIVREASADQLFALSKSCSTTLEGVTVHYSLPYKHPLVKACVREAKFYNNEKAQTLLAQVAAEALQALAEDMTAVSHQSIVIIPVPLSSVRQLKRGYNQVQKTISLIHEPWVKQSDTPLLERTKDTPAQSSLSRNERLLNMANAFSTSGPLHNHTLYIVVDDVVTTGATLASADFALRPHVPRESSVLLYAFSH